MVLKEKRWKRREGGGEREEEQVEGGESRSKRASGRCS